MSNQPPKTVDDVMGYLTQFTNQVRLLWRLLQDPRVPVVTKLIPAGVILYVLSPIDLIPDVIPVLGQLDDIGVIILGVNWFIQMCPVNIVEEHRRALGISSKQGDEVVDAEYRVVDDAKR